MIKRIFILLLLIFVCLQAGCKSENNQYKATDFYGKWTATEFITEEQIGINDFYPEKYIGHIITIKPNQFNMEFWEGIMPPQQVDHYTIEIENLWDVENADGRLKSELPINEDEVKTLHYKESNLEFTNRIGIIIDQNHLICQTSSGWYLYERD